MNELIAIPNIAVTYTTPGKSFLESWLSPIVAIKSSVI